MPMRPTILCPIDFSAASAGALRHAAAIAAHLPTRVVLLTVEDPQMTEAADLGTGILWRPDDTRAAMEDFVAETLGPDATVFTAIDYEVAVGKAATETLRVARQRDCDLIVMSTHGLTGIRKLFFGATTERVLRETSWPVLLTPPAHPGTVRLDDAKRLIGRIMVPVDLSPGSAHQVGVAQALGLALGLPLLLLHVVEPLKTPLASRLHLAGLEADRRAVAEDGLNALVAGIPDTLHPEGLVAYGDPAEEAAKVAHDRRAGLIVVGLHGSPLLGPRMGSVTYRLLCVFQGLVLALPPPPKQQEAHEGAGVLRAETSAGDDDRRGRGAPVQRVPQLAHNSPRAPRRQPRHH